MQPLAIKFTALVFATLILLAADSARAQEAAELDQDQRLEVESLLQKLGFDPGKVDGVFDRDSRIAIRSYQDFAALTPDGEADLKLLRELRSVAAAFAELPPVEQPEEAMDSPEETGEGPASDTAAEVSSAPQPAEKPEEKPEEPASEKPEADAAPTATGSAQSGTDAVPDDTGGEDQPLAGASPGESAVASPEPPAQKPEPPPVEAQAEEAQTEEAQAQEPQVPQVQEADTSGQKQSGFDLEGLMAKLSSSGGAAGTSAGSDPETQQQALLRAQNQDLFAQAYRAAKSRQYGRAIGSYEELTQKPGLNPAEQALVYFNLGNLWGELANNLRALESYDAALNLMPNFKEAHNNRAIVLKRLGQDREADKAVAEAKRLGLAWDGQQKPSFQSLAQSAGI